jgi:hypothetical protein
VRELKATEVALRRELVEATEQLDVVRLQLESDRHEWEAKTRSEASRYAQQLRSANYSALKQQQQQQQQQQEEEEAEGSQHVFDPRAHSPTSRAGQAAATSQAEILQKSLASPHARYAKGAGQGGAVQLVEIERLQRQLRQKETAESVRLDTRD